MAVYTYQVSVDGHCATIGFRREDGSSDLFNDSQSFAKRKTISVLACRSAQDAG